MANLIARIAVLLVLAAAGMVLADRKEKIDLSCVTAAVSGGSQCDLFFQPER